MMKNSTNSFYTRLEEQLNESSNWPTIYKFKFILKSNSKNINKLKNFFNDLNPKIESKLSSSNNFTSITVTAKMKSASLIIEKYKLASEIEGIISL